MVSICDHIGTYKVIAQSPTCRNVYFGEHSAALVSITLWRAVHLDSIQSYNAFMQEAQALVQLRHPHIVPVIDCGVEGDVPYIVAEDASSTYSILHAYTRRPLQEALSLLTQIGQALQHAHQHNVVHRQLMPECIRVDAEGQALLTGFGLATILKGTPPPLLDQIRLYPYTAPEQLQGNGECSALSDQYALGAIAYELLTGQQPWQPLEPPMQLNPSLPVSVELAILKAMAPCPTERYTDIDAFLAALSVPTYNALDEAIVPVAAQQNSSTTLEATPVESPFYDKVSEEEMATVQAAVTIEAPEVKDNDERNTYLSPVQRKPVDRSIWSIVSIVTLIVLVIGSLGTISLLLPTFQPSLPAAAATITITPMSKRVASVYTLGLVTGIPDAGKHQVSARILSFTSARRTKTVKTTGHGYQSATAAIGLLTFSHPGQEFVVRAGQTVSGARGIKVAVDTSFTVHVGESIAVLAHAVKAGARGNIPASDIDGTYNVVDNHTSQIITAVHIQNKRAFSNGHSAYGYTSVQQSDIDTAVNALVNQLQPNTKLVVERELRPHEQFADTVACTSIVETDHKANDSATEVTVVVSLTCAGEAYSPAQMRALAASLLMSDVATRLGTRYVLFGNVQTSVPAVQQRSAGNGINLFRVNAQGVWAFQFNVDQQQTLAQSIAGKPQGQTLALLRKQQGVHDVSVNTFGWFGSALPASADDIKFLITSIRGLQ